MVGGFRVFWSIRVKNWESYFFDYSNKDSASRVDFLVGTVLSVLRICLFFCFIGFV